MLKISKEHPQIVDDPVMLSKIFSQLEQHNEIKSSDFTQEGERNERRERQERSKERILESLKNLEMRIDKYEHHT